LPVAGALAADLTASGTAKAFDAIVGFAVTSL
jgi:hypothetical protein